MKNLSTWREHLLELLTTIYTDPLFKDNFKDKLEKIIELQGKSTVFFLDHALSFKKGRPAF